jgi:hypothetical protein
MFLLIFLVISVALAIPTFGVSLLVFFFVKNWFDNKAMSSLLGAAVTAMREEVSQERYHINRAAIRKVFSRFADGPPEIHSLGRGGVTLYWGLVRHPMINNNQVFSVRFGYIPRQGTTNTVFVKAAPGVNREVLSADDLIAHSLNPVASNSSSEFIDRSKPKTDADIRTLIEKIASSGRTDCKLPNLQYGRIGDFVDEYSNGTEYFPNYSGMRFWIDIGESEYAVYIENSDPTKEDAGSVSISAKLVGAAQQIA